MRENYVYGCDILGDNEDESSVASSVGPFVNAIYERGTDASVRARINTILQVDPNEKSRPTVREAHSPATMERRGIANLR